MSNEPKQEFKVSLEYPGYVFLGWATGLFSTPDGRKVPYSNMYVLSPVSSYESEAYKASGMKSEKMKCLSPEVWEGLMPGDRVRLFFDNKGRVIESALDG